jgi:hypothetical protein
MKLTVPRGQQAAFVTTEDYLSMQITGLAGGTPDATGAALAAMFDGIVCHRAL